MRDERRTGERNQNDFTIEDGKVMGIPTGQPPGDIIVPDERYKPYSDEVDVFARVGEDLGGITVSMLTALVILKEDLPKLRKMVDGLELPLIPVFTTDFTGITFIGTANGRA